MTGSRSVLEYRPLPSDDPMQRKPDIRLARETIDCTPAVALEQGLEKTILYFEKLLTHA